MAAKPLTNTPGEMQQQDSRKPNPYKSVRGEFVMEGAFVAPQQSPLPRREAPVTIRAELPRPSQAFSEPVA